MGTINVKLNCTNY